MEEKNKKLTIINLFSFGYKVSVFGYFVIDYWSSIADNSSHTKWIYPIGIVLGALSL